MEETPRMKKLLSIHLIFVHVKWCSRQRLPGQVPKYQIQGAWCESHCLLRIAGSPGHVSTVHCPLGREWVWLGWQHLALSGWFCPCDALDPRLGRWRKLSMSGGTCPLLNSCNSFQGPTCRIWNTNIFILYSFHFLVYSLLICETETILGHC